MKEKRTFAAIAKEIKKVWSKPYFGAVPYLDALETIHSTDKDVLTCLKRQKIWFCTC